MLNEEIHRYTELSGNNAEHESIQKIGAYLDGYDKGVADVRENINREYDEWCTDCKEYDKERHCCPRWNKVIRDTMDEIRQNAEKNWDKVEVVRCKDCKYHAEFSSKCNKLHLTPMLPNYYCSYGERRE